MACFPFSNLLWMAGDERFPRSRLSDALGVGHFFAKAGSPFLGLLVSKFPRFKASFALGVGIDARKLRGERPAERSATAFVLLASGVGNNPYPVSSVRCTNGTRRYAMPFRVIPDRGHVSENCSQPSTKQRCHVLQHSPSRSNHAKGSNDFPVESRTGSGKSGAVAGKTDVLTREPSRDDIRFTFLEFHRGYVFIAGNWPEILFKNRPSVGLHFAKSNGLEPASALQAQAETADTGKKVDDTKLAHSSRSLMIHSAHVIRMPAILRQRLASRSLRERGNLFIQCSQAGTELLLFNFALLD
jgi:hypothetical protein